METEGCHEAAYTWTRVALDEHGSIPSLVECLKQLGSDGLVLRADFTQQIHELLLVDRDAPLETALHIWNTLLKEFARPDGAGLAVRGRWSRGTRLRLTVR
jgi:hypothetical protein